MPWRSPLYIGAEHRNAGFGKSFGQHLQRHGLAGAVAPVTSPWRFANFSVSYSFSLILRSGFRPAPTKICGPATYVSGFLAVFTRGGGTGELISFSRYSIDGIVFASL
jgi:hypothetical protein